VSKSVLILPGDGIGPEIVTEAEKVLSALAEDHGLQISTEQGLIGGSAIDETGVPLPEETLRLHL
jgi:3-isopropylmalate dehydrogenase